MTEPRIVFMGSPEFAVPILQALASRYRVSGVVTQPDRPSGRGKRLSAPAVKTACVGLNIPVIQPARLSQPEAMQQLSAWKPDLVVVAAFGQILRQQVLELPRFGCLNVHASLLPRWRGAAPIQAAILNGDEETGISIMLMDAGLDTGPVISQKSTPILPNETAGSLSARLAFIGAELLLETLPGYLNGNLQPVPQDSSSLTLAPRLTKADGLLDFSQPASKLVRRVRAFNPWPGAYTSWKGQILKVQRASVSAGEGLKQSGAPGTRSVLDGYPAITTSEGLLVLEEVQPAGKKPLAGKAFILGAREWGNLEEDAA